MKRFVYLGLAFGRAVAAFYAGAVWGGRDGLFKSALAENRVAVLNIDSSPEMNPQFREYLKARVYSNILQFYPADRGYLIQNDWDRGPVDRAVLGSIHASKDPTGAAWDWHSAVSGKLR